MTGYQSETIFHLPGAFEHFPIYRTFLKIYQEQYFMFKDNVKIGSVYGAPSGIWNGESLLPRHFYAYEELKNNYELYQKYNIPVRLTFTNSLLETRHNLDSYGNLLLEIFNTGYNIISCCAPELIDYIVENYNTQYKIAVHDVAIDNLDKYKTYDIISLSCLDNKNLEKLKQLDMDNIEIVCNAPCLTKDIMQQYRYGVDYAQLNYTLPNLPNECLGKFETYIFSKNADHYVSARDINNIYLPMGIKNFRLDGRATGPLNIIEILIDYLIKPEYHLYVRQTLHDALF